MSKEMSLSQRRAQILIDNMFLQASSIVAPFVRTGTRERIIFVSTHTSRYTVRSAHNKKNKVRKHQEKRARVSTATKSNIKEVQRASRILYHADMVLLRVAPQIYISHTPPQYVARPSSFAKCFTFIEGSALVSASATISSVGQ